MMNLRFLLALTLAGATLSACYRPHVYNEAYPLPREQETAEFNRMANDPVRLECPVVVIAGYFSPKILNTGFARRIADLTSGDYTTDFHVIGAAGIEHIDDFSDLIVNTIGERFGWQETPDPITGRKRTVEVDIIGVSMGGLGARHAAIASIDNPDRPILKIHNLYTLATPHRGATLAAKAPTMDQAAIDMLPKSILITRLNEALPEIDYTIIPYAIIGDDIVGEDRSAPPGYDPIWIPGRRLASHLDAIDNPRAVLDIAARLRNETPYGQPSPIPAKEDRIAFPPAPENETTPDKAPGVESTESTL